MEDKLDIKQKEPWYIRGLKEKRKEILTSAVSLVAFSLTIAIWHFYTGKAFEWQDISPIEEPGLVPRIFYSALVFIGPGWFLYHKLKFWKFLYEPYRGGGRGAYREYKNLKAGIWGLLILLMYFVIVPFVVDLLNTIISFFFNLYVLVIYLAPSIGITGLLYGTYRLVRHLVLYQK